MASGIVARAKETNGDEIAIARVPSETIEEDTVFYIYIHICTRRNPFTTQPTTNNLGNSRTESFSRVRVRAATRTSRNTTVGRPSVFLLFARTIFVPKIDLGGEVFFL